MPSLVDVKDVLKNRKKWKKRGEYTIRTENGYTILRYKRSLKKSSKLAKLIDGEILEIPKDLGDEKNNPSST